MRSKERWIVHLFGNKDLELLQEWNFENSEEHAISTGGTSFCGRVRRGEDSVECIICVHELLTVFSEEKSISKMCCGGVVGRYRNSNSFGATHCRSSICK